MVSFLSLRTSPIPDHLHSRRPQINKYLSFFISPEKALENEFIHLKIYDVEGLLPSKIGLDILLIEIKWYLKLQKKDQYIRSCN